MKNALRFAVGGSVAVFVTAATLTVAGNDAEARGGHALTAGAELSGAKGKSQLSASDTKPKSPDDVVDRPDENDPLSSMVAVSMPIGMPMNIADFVKTRTDQYATDTLPANVEFPLDNATTDTVRVLPELQYNVLAKWFDPLTPGNGIDAPRFGSNCDYIAYFGTGWNSDWAGDVVGSAPQYSGSGSSGWIWSNHEYISNGRPSVGNAPTGQMLTLAKYLQDRGVLNFDVTNGALWNQPEVDEFIRAYKKELGGSWFRVFRSPQTGEWRIFRDPRAKRYDGSDATLLRLTGHQLNAPDTDDSGVPLPNGVVVGITGDCSGGQSPWGTVVSAEENVQTYYGDLETSWTSSQRFVPGQGFDAGSNIAPTYAASTGAHWGAISNPDERHDRDVYGYLAELDPGKEPDLYYEAVDGEGHRKLGVMGRARWENTTFVTGADWRLIDGQPVVMYGGNDRRSGRIYKWVSAAPYTDGMTKTEVRDLLNSGKLYVGHFAGLDNDSGDTLSDGVRCVSSNGLTPTEDNRGTGIWIEMSVNNNAQVAPNAVALGDPAKTVGAALQDVNWNSIGGFPNDNMVRTALFTAANKLGVMELNRPEDLEWNPKDPSGTPRLYVVFTKNGRPTALEEDGVLIDPAIHSNDCDDGGAPRRPDPVGSIFVVEEEFPNDAGNSTTFDYWAAFKGTQGTGPLDVGNPDNAMIDADGGVWFGTDGNFGLNGTADALYYLDLDPAHKAGETGVVNPTFGRGLRVIAGPSDSEATGPAFSSDMNSVFFNVQHPGEGRPSSWPAR